ncbi:hypothetical protein TeGR_g7605, partial [Tetraparma gracilis]
ESANEMLLEHGDFADPSCPDPTANQGPNESQYSDHSPRYPSHQQPPVHPVYATRGYAG